MVRDAFASRQYCQQSALQSIRELARIYGLEPSPAPQDAPEAEG